MDGLESACDRGIFSQRRTASYLPVDHLSPDSVCLQRGIDGFYNSHPRDRAIPVII